MQVAPHAPSGHKLTRAAPAGSKRRAPAPAQAKKRPGQEPEGFDVGELVSSVGITGVVFIGIVLASVAALVVRF